MKLTIQKVPMRDLAAELVRRRGKLIDALCEELAIMDHEVEHDPPKKQRQLRLPNDFLTERCIVDGVVMQLRIRAVLEDGSLLNRLELRYGFVDPDTDAVAVYVTAKEPKGGFDVIVLAQRFMRKVADGVSAYVKREILSHAQESADAITNAFGASDVRFKVSAQDDLYDEDFGPLEVTFSGLCSHMVVKLIREINKAHERGGCGADDDVRTALERRARDIPKSELN